MEPVGACAGVSDRFDLARCLPSPSNLNGLIKREESALVSGQIYSLSPLFFYLDMPGLKYLNKSACTSAHAQSN